MLPFPAEYSLSQILCKEESKCPRPKLTYKNITCTEDICLAIGILFVIKNSVTFCRRIFLFVAILCTLNLLFIIRICYLSSEHNSLLTSEPRRAIPSVKHIFILIRRQIFIWTNLKFQTFRDELFSFFFMNTWCVKKISLKKFKKEKKDTCGLILPCQTVQNVVFPRGKSISAKGNVTQ